MWLKGALWVSTSCCGEGSTCKGHGSALLPPLGTWGALSEMPITTGTVLRGGTCACPPVSLVAGWGSKRGSSPVTSTGWQAEEGSTLPKGAFAACVPLGGLGRSDEDPKAPLLNVAG